MQMVIDIPEEVYKRTKFYHEFRDLNDCVITLKAIDNAVPLEDIKAEIKQGLDIIGTCEDYEQGYDNATKRALMIIEKHIRGDADD